MRAPADLYRLGRQHNHRVAVIVKAAVGQGQRARRDRSCGGHRKHRGIMSRTKDGMSSKEAASKPSRLKKSAMWGVTSRSCVAPLLASSLLPLLAGFAVRAPRRTTVRMAARPDRRSQRRLRDRHRTPSRRSSRPTPRRAASRRRRAWSSASPRTSPTPSSTPTPPRARGGYGARARSARERRRSTSRSVECAPAAA